MEKKTEDFKPANSSKEKSLTLPLSQTNGEDSGRLPPPKSSWLLRLFESKMFDMSIAVAYLFNAKETGVLAYLGNKLFVSMPSNTFYDS